MSRQPQTTRSFHFSTGDIPVGERADAVHRLRERGILPVEALMDRAPHVELAKWFSPGVAILLGTLGGVRQEGVPQAGGGGDDLFLGVNLAGSCHVAQRGREITLGDGDATLLNLAAGAFSIVRPTLARFVGLRVPRKVISPLVTGLDDPPMHLIPGATSALRLLTSYVRAIIKSEALDSPEISQVVATHLHDLIALSIGATQDAAAAAEDRSVRAVRLRAIKSDIVANLADDTLTIAAIASRHGVTPRYVHKLFESEGTTYTQFVLRQRLDRAYRLLRDPRLAACGISTIAYDVGFGDLSYFNRTFRRHYKATPSDIRNSRTA